MEGRHETERQCTSHVDDVVVQYGGMRTSLQAISGALDLLNAGEPPNRPVLAALLAIATIHSQFELLASDPSIPKAGGRRLVEALRGSFDRVDGAVDEFLLTRSSVSLHRLRIRMGELLDGAGELEALLGV